LGPIGGTIDPTAYGRGVLADELTMVKVSP
jgi:hypothetical protein